MTNPTADHLVSRLRNYGNAVPGTLADAEPSATSLEATPPVISGLDQCEKDTDCGLGKDHTGDCDDLPF